MDLSGKDGRTRITLGGLEITYGERMIQVDFIRMEIRDTTPPVICPSVEVQQHRI